MVSTCVFCAGENCEGQRRGGVALQGYGPLGSLTATLTRGRASDGECVCSCAGEDCRNGEGKGQGGVVMDLCRSGQPDYHAAGWAGLRMARVCYLFVPLVRVFAPPSPMLPARLPPPHDSIGHCRQGTPAHLHTVHSYPPVTMCPPHGPPPFPPNLSLLTPAPHWFLPNLHTPASSQQARHTSTPAQGPQLPACDLASAP